jgi:crotonobetainyl-CoA:carnitine CoA-transferase CaiB-like acyl-CoA transferase
VKALDLSRGVAGGYCGAMLRLIGVEVTRAEFAGAPPPDDDPEALAYVNAGKLALTTPLTAATLPDALAGVDALIEDWGSGVLETLDLHEETLRARSPALILVRLSPFGLNGPRAGDAGSDLVSLAAGGMLFITGGWQQPPVQLAPHQAALTHGLLAAVAAAGALWGGEPVTLDLSAQEAVLALASPAPSEYLYAGTIPAREGTVAAMARIEPAADTWVYAGPGAALSADYARFGAFLGIPEFSEERFRTADGRLDNWEEHRRLIGPVLRSRTAQEWVDAAAEARLTFGRVQTTTELLDCETLAERGFWQGDGAERQPRGPFIVDGARGPLQTEEENA